MSADQLRSRVVLLIVRSIIVLAAGLYALIGALLLLHQWQHGDLEGFTLPGELWLAAGVFAAALVGFLSNSKGGAEGGTGTGPLEVRAPVGEPLAVREAAAKWDVRNTSAAGDAAA